MIGQTTHAGPVLSIIPYTTEEEAIEIANDTIFGLNNGVASADMDRPVTHLAVV